MCNGQLHQRGIIIINDYATKDKKQKLTNLKGEIFQQLETSIFPPK